MKFNELTLQLQVTAQNCKPLKSMKSRFGSRKNRGRI